MQQDKLISNNLKQSQLTSLSPMFKKYRNSNYTMLHGLINGETKR